MSSRTAEEARQHYVAVMGEELGSLYHRLWNEVAWLYSKWEEYVELFGTKPTRIDLLNEAAGHFFRVVQDCLWEDTLLHIARLTDSSQTARRENVSIRRLPTLISSDSVREAVQAKVDEAIAKAEACRDWRNRRIAHMDLELALSEGAEPLKPASRASVRAAMDAIADVLNTVGLHLLDSTTAFEGAGLSNGALNLLYVIDDGLKAERARRERLKSGKHHADDYQRRDL
jgi:hypothetical protein